MSDVFGKVVNENGEEVAHTIHRGEHRGIYLQHATVEMSVENFRTLKLQFIMLDGTFQNMPGGAFGTPSTKDIALLEHSGNDPIKTVEAVIKHNVIDNSGKVIGHIDPKCFGPIDES